MKRLLAAGPRRWLAALVVVLGMVAIAPAWAQLAITVQTPDGTRLDVTARNMPRGDEALVLYDREFGISTRTNPYGVEVVAEPLDSQAGQYRVTGITRIWDCQQQPDLSACGNAVIPPDGVVLSATGSLREALKNLKPGDTLLLDRQYFKQTTADISVTDPSPENNPMGSGFPGYRASNQLIVYDAAYGRPTTGTNEFGFEVTVRDGLVVTQEGSDSAIPDEPGGFVLSGHGKARSWLIENAPLGAHISLSPDGKQVTTVIGFDTYRYQFDRQYAESPCARLTAPDAACQDIMERVGQAQSLFEDGKANQAAALLLDAKESLSRRTWMAATPFPPNALKGVWLRPTETTRQAIGSSLDQIRQAGLNSVFLETYFHGYTIFPSQTFADYGLPRQNPKFAGVDLLQLWIEEAHKRGMRVHVWFQTFYAGTKAYDPPGPVLRKYPQWANVQYVALKPLQFCDAASSGPAPPANDCSPTVTTLLESPKEPVPSNLETGAYFLDPANPEARAFLMRLAEEIVTRYPVDGFQLDYIRYPASFPRDRFSYHKTTWGYTDVARQEFKARYGVDPAMLDPKNPDDAAQWNTWNLFKVEQVSGFVEEVTQRLHQKRPELLISAAVFPNPEDSLALKHQDWRTWARAGWVDFLAPMTLTSAVKVVENDTRRMINATDNRIPVDSGVFGPFNNNSAELVVTQIEAARQAGASGFVLFDYAHLTPRMLEALRLSQSRAAAAPLPPAPPTGLEGRKSRPTPPSAR